MIEKFKTGIITSAKYKTNTFFKHCNENDIKLSEKSMSLIFLDSIVHSILTFEYLSPISFYLVKDEIEKMIDDETFMENLTGIKFNNYKMSKYINNELSEYYSIEDEAEPNLILSQIKDDDIDIIKKITKRYIGIIGCRAFEHHDIPLVTEKIIIGLSFENSFKINTYYLSFADFFIDADRNYIYKLIYDSETSISDKNIINLFSEMNNNISFNDCYKLCELAIYKNKAFAYHFLDSMCNNENILKSINKYQFEHSFSSPNSPINIQRYTFFLSNYLYASNRFGCIFSYMIKGISYEHFLCKYVNSIFYYIYSKAKNNSSIFDNMILSIYIALKIHEENISYNLSDIEKTLVSFLNNSSLGEIINGKQYSLYFDPEYHDDSCFIYYLSKMTIVFLFLYYKTLNNDKIIISFFELSSNDLEDIGEFIDTIYFDEKSTFGDNELLWNKINKYNIEDIKRSSTYQFNIEKKSKNLSLFSFTDFNKSKTVNSNTLYEINPPKRLSIDEIKSKYLLLSDKYINDFIKYDYFYYEDIDSIFSRTENINNATKLIELLEKFNNNENEKLLSIEIANTLLEMGSREPYDKNTGIHYNFEPSAFEKGPGVCWLIYAYVNNYFSDFNEIIDYYKMGTIKTNKYIDNLVLIEAKKGNINNLKLIEYFPENEEIIYSFIKEKKYVAYGFLMFILFEQKRINECKQYAKLFKQYSTKEEKEQIISVIYHNHGERESFEKYRQFLIRSNIDKYLSGYSLFLHIK